MNENDTDHAKTFQNVISRYFLSIHAGNASRNIKPTNNEHLQRSESMRLLIPDKTTNKNEDSGVVYDNNIATIYILIYTISYICT